MLATLKKKFGHMKAIVPPAKEGGGATSVPNEASASKQIAENNTSANKTTTLKDIMDSKKASNEIGNIN